MRVKAAGRGFSFAERFDDGCKGERRGCCTWVMEGPEKWVVMAEALGIWLYDGPVEGLLCH